MSRSIAIIAASGIGDALLLQVLTTFAKLKGDTLTLFHPQAKVLATLFPDLKLQTLNLSSSNNALASFDLIFVQNDHSETAYRLHALRKERELSQTIFIHPKRSRLVQDGDIVFDTQKGFVTNLLKGAAPFFKPVTLCKKAVQQALEKSPLHENTEKKARLKEIALHPTSADPMRNWPQSKFVALYKKLKAKGFTPYFIVQEKEQAPWKKAGIPSCDLPLFENLAAIKSRLEHASYFIGNDSGMGHLASLLGVRTVTISNNKKRVMVWRPDFSKGLIVTPWLLLPSFRSLNLALRERFWHHFVSVQAVMNTFEKLQGAFDE